MPPYIELYFRDPRDILYVHGPDGGVGEVLIVPLFAHMNPHIDFATLEGKEAYSEDYVVTAVKPMVGYALGTGYEITLTMNDEARERARGWRTAIDEINCKEPA